MIADFIDSQLAYILNATRNSFDPRPVKVDRLSGVGPGIREPPQFEGVASYFFAMPSVTKVTLDLTDGGRSTANTEPAFKRSGHRPLRDMVLHFSATTGALLHN